MRHLESLGLFSELDRRSGQLYLFQKHFLIMHAVYAMQKVQPSAWEVSLTNIRYSPSAADHQSHCRELAAPSFASEYYLDRTHFESATEATVSKLLDEFWQGYQAWAMQDELFIPLGIEKTADWEIIVRAYRKQAQLHHPDRGGDATAFAKVQEAYQSLKTLYGP